MTYTEYEAEEERASNAELERLARLSAAELVQRIERGQFGNYDRADLQAHLEATLKRLEDNAVPP